jgi:hypothetical protein
LSAEVLGGPACKAAGETREFREYQQRGADGVRGNRVNTCWMTGFIARGTNLLGEARPIDFKRFAELALKLGCMNLKKVLQGL